MSKLTWKYGKKNECPKCHSLDIHMTAPKDRPRWKGGKLVLTCGGCGKQNRPPVENADG